MVPNIPPKVATNPPNTQAPGLVKGNPALIAN